MKKIPEIKRSEPGLPTYAAVLVVFCFLFGLLFFGGRGIVPFFLDDPILPDEDDCRARGKAADCWRDALRGTGKEVYDLDGRRRP